jgi:hypothetical protein
MGQMMSISFSAGPARLVALFMLSVAMLASPIAVAADTGGSNADLGLDGVTISTTSIVGRTGLVTVAGRVECSQDVDAYVWAEVSQVVGRTSTISGGNATEVQCLAADGSAGFSLSFYAWSGKFAGGQARVQGGAETAVCTEEECFFDAVAFGPTNVRLSH